MSRHPDEEKRELGDGDSPDDPWCDNWLEIANAKSENLKVPEAINPKPEYI
jgi:hypothetical protein